MSIMPASHQRLRARTVPPTPRLPIHRILRGDHGIRPWWISSRTSRYCTAPHGLPSPAYYLMLQSTLTVSTGRRIHRFLHIHSEENALFSLSRLPLAACHWPPSPNALLSFGEQAVTVVVVGTVVQFVSDSCHGTPLPAHHRLGLELARNLDYPLYAEVLRRWAVMEPRISLNFEAWAFGSDPEPSHHPHIEPEIYLSTHGIGYQSDRITFADLRIHDVVRLEAYIARGVSWRVYFHMKRVDVLQRSPS
ncbi:hypothetical protein L227DRAFT_618135 [Lentinus tigrinus ALCF2SS1-6]|uniref:Uncharacterized protein n=1 Tax=Lentinus tigrinus ALCF2SS1-6 TaxID=1328759 RepID=A0A5C2RLL5_9APHY|nr:hypothetical protein L227DRAFT_618135 [Lentinus tigrinus ALCF2SS1-6]